MLDLELINNTIEELENEDTNFSTCQKLASLYTIRYFYTGSETDHKVESELKDILPQYRRYCEVKRHYQLSEVSEHQVLISLESVCTEIKEFLHVMYSSTDMEEERTRLKTMVQEIHSEFVL